MGLASKRLGPGLRFCQARALGLSPGFKFPYVELARFFKFSSTKGLRVLLRASAFASAKCEIVRLFGSKAFAKQHHFRDYFVPFHWYMFVFTHVFVLTCTGSFFLVHIGSHSKLCVRSCSFALHVSFLLICVRSHLFAFIFSCTRSFLRVCIRFHVYAFVFTCTSFRFHLYVISLSLVLALSWRLFSRARSLLSHPFNLTKQPSQEHYSTLSIHFCNTGQIRLTCRTVSRVLSLSPRATRRLSCTVPLAPCNVPSLVLALSWRLFSCTTTTRQRRLNDTTRHNDNDTTTFSHGLSCAVFLMYALFSRPVSCLVFCVRVCHFSHGFLRAVFLIYTL